eukprot:gene14252-16820_t
MPYAPIWRSTIDLFSQTPEYHFDTIKDIRARRSKFETERRGHSGRGRGPKPPKKNTKKK